MGNKLHKILLIFVAALLLISSFSLNAEAKSSDKKAVFLLQAANSKNDTAIKLTWNSYPNAKKYVVYAAKCGTTLKKYKTVKTTKLTVSKIGAKELVKNNAYKFRVLAYDKKGKLIADSKQVHFILGNTKGKFANVKSITPKKKSLSLKPGKSATISVTKKYFGNKKHLAPDHGIATRYISDNTKVAKVSSKGKVTAVGTGKATIYVQDIGGKYCKVSVTVKFDGYTVSFDTGNGSKVEPQVVKPGEKAVEPSFPTLANYEFAGWFLDLNNPEEFDFSTPINSDITLHAKWVTPGSRTFKAVIEKAGGRDKLYFYYDDVNHSGANKIVYDSLPTNADSEDDWPYFSYSHGGDGLPTEVIKYVIVDKSMRFFHDLRSICYMFTLPYVIDFKGAEYLDVSNVTNMDDAFYLYGASTDEAILSIPNVSDWDVSKATSMVKMFQLFGSGDIDFNMVPDVSKWKTTSLVNINKMFDNYAVVSLKLDKVPNVSNWDVGNLTDFSYAFAQYGAASEQLMAVPDLSSWSTGSARNMSYMFYCYGGRAPEFNAVPDVSGLDVSNVSTFKGMFYGYGSESTNLNKVPDVSHWVTSSATEVGSMFYTYGYASTTLTETPDVTNWDVSRVSSFETMFYAYGMTSTNLTFTLDLRNWVPSSATDTGNMFSYSGNSGASWSVTIPSKTAPGYPNDNSAAYYYMGADGSTVVASADGREFTVQ